jgi:CBS domain-containing protein
MHAKVKDLMTQPVFFCSSSDPASTAARIMWEHDCGIVPVVDEDRRLAGIVTDRDICMAAYLQGRPPAEIAIDTFMTREPSSCHPDDELIWAEHLMSERQVHRVPVVDSRGTLIGMLSMSDLAREARHSGNGRHRDELGDDLLQTIAAVSKPRSQATHAH